MLEGYLDSWGSSSEESVEQHRADSRCIGVLALLAGGGTVEMMPISHFINLLRGTFSMNLLLSNRDSGQVLKMCLNIYKSLRVHWSWILSWSQLYFTNFPKGKLFRRVWNASLEDYIPTVLGKTRLYSHTLSVEETTECRDLTWSTLNLIWVWGKELICTLSYQWPSGSHHQDSHTWKYD